MLDLRIKLKPLCASGIIAVLGLLTTTNNSLSFDIGRPFSGADSAAADFFSDTFKAYYLPAHRGLDAGDHLRTPMFVIAPQASTCFGNNAQGWGEQRIRKKEEYDENRFSVSFKFMVLSGSAEVSLLTGPIYDLEHLQTRHIRPTKLAQYDKSKCPWLSDLIQNNQYDGVHLLVYEVVLAKGWIKDKRELVVKGDVNFDGMKKIAEGLEALGVLRKFSGFMQRYLQKIEIKGEYTEKTKEDQVHFPTERVVAFVPWTVNREAMSRYIREFLYDSGNLGQLRRSLEMPEGARAFLSDRPDFKIGNGERSPLLRTGTHIQFDPNDPGHAVAQRIDSMIVTANHMANQK